MIIFKEAGQISQYILQQKKEDKKTGFVPTMGALHQGHLSLIQTSVKENDLTVCSIFINPAQFNNPDDFKKYPVTIEKDIEHLLNAGCNVLFLPAANEMYPPSYTKSHHALGDLENILEGYYRPGHFQGVCQAVDRLLQIIKAENLYLGQKDFQQCMVIKKLLQLTGKANEIALKIESTIREKDGLAMSSRNLRLNPEQREQAILIYQTLQFIKANSSKNSMTDLKDAAIKRLEEAGFVVDYVEIADADTLKSVEAINQNSVALIAASIGDIRLIDNILLE